VLVVHQPFLSKLRDKPTVIRVSVPISHLFKLHKVFASKSGQSQRHRRLCIATLLHFVGQKPDSNSTFVVVLENDRQSHQLVRSQASLVGIIESVLAASTLWRKDSAFEIAATRRAVIDAFNDS
jgi:hypothetical protein